MRKELRGYLDQGYDDNRILATFVDKYGGRVRSSPPTDDWFNLSAWIMPFFALFGGGLLVVYFLKTWKAATSQQPAPAAIDPSKYQAEIEEELRRLTPED
jgi:cytochrome c-type biogenesis protein CcmH/NrfF